jgi:hypothetical protein
VIQDSTPPRLELLGENPQPSEAGFAWLDPGIAFSDDTCHPDISVEAVKQKGNKNKKRNRGILNFAGFFGIFFSFLSFFHFFLSFPA